MKCNCILYGGDGDLMNIDWSSSGIVFEYSSPLDELVHERVSSSFIDDWHWVSSTIDEFGDYV